MLTLLTLSTCCQHHFGTSHIWPPIYADGNPTTLKSTGPMTTSFKRTLQEASTALTLKLNPRQDQSRIQHHLLIHTQRLRSDAHPRTIAIHTQEVHDQRKPSTSHRSSTIIGLLLSNRMHAMLSSQHFNQTDDVGT